VEEVRPGATDVLSLALGLERLAQRAISADDPGNRSASRTENRESPDEDLDDPYLQPPRPSLNARCMTLNGRAGVSAKSCERTRVGESGLLS
jgi:hypothetical protein